MRMLIELDEVERSALTRAAWAQRRRPRELAEWVLRRYLVKRGYLDDPTGGGRTAGREKQAGSAERLTDGRAASV